MSYCLVVEDSNQVRRIMCRMLTELGQDVLEAEGPVQGIDICQGLAPPIIFLDWDLPGFGALEFLRVLPSYDFRPQIVLCMTKHAPKEIALGKAAGASLQLMKPYDKPAVLRVLTRLENAVRANERLSA